MRRPMPPHNPQLPSFGKLTTDVSAVYDSTSKSSAPRAFTDTGDEHQQRDDVTDLRDSFVSSVESNSNPSIPCIRRHLIRTQNRPPVFRFVGPPKRRDLDEIVVERAPLVRTGR